VASKPIDTPGGIKLQDDVTGKMDGSVATAGKTPPAPLSPRLAHVIKMEGILDDARAGKISYTEVSSAFDQLEDFEVSPAMLEAYKKYQATQKPIIAGGRAKILSKEDYLKNLSAYGVDEKIADKAAIVLSTKPPFLIAVSGKLASGKDTIAAEVFKELQGEPHHLYFAAALKDEVDELMVVVRNTKWKWLCRIKAQRKFSINKDMAKHMVDLLHEPARSAEGLGLNARDRTPWIRLALQYWGVEVRRTQDPDYWVKQAIKSAATAIAEGKDIMVTDVRFPGEVEACQGIGFTVIRLNITTETQAARIMARDGLINDPKALVHATEVALDGFDAFNIVIDNNDSTIEETVKTFLSQFN
jgi:hypothetical protein